ncbi:hypothetical protein CVS28_16880 [Arthrobacter glacialis]|nr:hypothetical protein CVS28_16880 [Arthrobacter glacialis]
MGNPVPVAMTAIDMDGAFRRGFFDCSSLESKWRMKHPTHYPSDRMFCHVDQRECGGKTMFEHFTTPDEILHYRLGAALTMEYDALEMIAAMEKGAMRSDLRELLHEHTHETRQQIEFLQRCYSMLGVDVHQTPSPTSKGLAKESNAFMAKTDSTLVDAVILAGVLEVDHYASAVYETLVIQAKALGAAGVVELLTQTLAQKKATIEKILVASETIAHADATDHADGDTRPQSGVQVPPYLPPSMI